ncbi:hypothetical protein [Oligoflexus tunisiensis]|uniref:hypothetical protein n=1 Tax=Oligoflexus tunisiensis TaxID=708132 RepID=UPI00114CA178|nr:hypothetical protein [Oligoflexus tunisiensis]
MKTFVLLAFLLSLQGCVTPAVCTMEGAFDTGRQAALDGKPSDFDPGNVCTGEDRETARQSYQKGYDAGRTLLCSVQNASNDGKDAGLQGENLQGLPLRYQLCTQDKDQLEKSFMSGYRLGLEEFCKVDTAKNRGDQAGRSNQPELDVDAAYLSCPQAQRSKLKQAWQKAYLQGLRAYCQPAQHLESIRREAQASDRPAFDPATFGNCAQRFPELLEEYHALFDRERKAVVQKLCTFENGLDQGKADALKTNQRRAGSPEFCDEKAAHAWLRGYDRGWLEQKRELCLLEDFHERGYQDATRGLPADPRFPELCPSDYYHDMRERYQAGYERGRGHGPHHPHHDDKHEDLVDACGRVFSFSSEKLECIKASQNIRHGAADVIAACGQAFTFSSDRMKCIISAAGRSYNSTAVIRSCKTTASFASDVQVCISTVKEVRYNPARAIDACHQAFPLGSDRKECWNHVAREPRDPSERIQSCRKTFQLGSDVLKCLRS